MVTTIRAAAAASQKRFIDASFTRLTPPSTAFSHSQTEPGINMFGSVEQLRESDFLQSAISHALRRSVRR
jgi:hypothetical protein